MPKKNAEKLVHLDINKLAQTTAAPKEEDTSLGGLLRAKRIKKKWEIEDVSRKLRIKPIYLEALEQGHYYAFPARSYGVGFLRSYSKLLDLDPDKMTALFNQETTDDKEQPIDMLVMEKHFSLPSLKLIFAVLCLIFGLYLVWYGMAMGSYSDLLKQESFFEKSATLINKSVVVPKTSQEEIATEIQEPVVVEEKKVEQPKIEEKAEEFPTAVLTAPAAFVATNTVWVGLKNITTNQLLVSKKFLKNESFIPETPISELAISTGRPKSLDLYVNGKKVKTFSRENWLPLAEFSEIPQEATNE